MLTLIGQFNSPMGTVLLIKQQVQMQNTQNISHLPSRALFAHSYLVIFAHYE